MLDNRSMLSVGGVSTSMSMREFEIAEAAIHMSENLRGAPPASSDGG